ncbi:MAG: T9SS C-terminal target domain-containing protein, partial [Calditrichaeota bacterium]
GDRINVLYWDDLLVGTGTGLYGQMLESPMGISTTNPPRLIQTPQLYQNYPNPFNPVTSIHFLIPHTTLRASGADNVQLLIYDLLGRKVKTLLNTVLPAGEHTVQWDGTDDAGQPVGSGIYLYQLKFGKNIQTRKMVLIR